LPHNCASNSSAKAAHCPEASHKAPVRICGQGHFLIQGKSSVCLVAINRWVAAAEKGKFFHTVKEFYPCHAKSGLMANGLLLSKAKYLPAPVRGHTL
jgi:hypothetical protein